MTLTVQAVDIVCAIEEFRVDSFNAFVDSITTASEVDGDDDRRIRELALSPFFIYFL
jgi:hypothetical protein